MLTSEEPYPLSSIAPPKGVNTPSLSLLIIRCRGCQIDFRCAGGANGLGVVVRVREGCGAIARGILVRPTAGRPQPL